MALKQLQLAFPHINVGSQRLKLPSLARPVLKHPEATLSSFSVPCGELAELEIRVEVRLKYRAMCRDHAFVNFLRVHYCSRLNISVARKISTTGQQTARETSTARTDLSIIFG